MNTRFLMQLLWSNPSATCPAVLVEGVGEARPAVQKQDISAENSNRHNCLSSSSSQFGGILVAGRSVVCIGLRGSRPASTTDRHGCGGQGTRNEGKGMARLPLVFAADSQQVHAARIRVRQARIENHDLPPGGPRPIRIGRHTRHTTFASLVVRTKSVLPEAPNQER